MSTLYGYAPNGEIERINLRLPAAIGNTWVTADGAAAHGLFPITGSEPTYDVATQRLTGPTYQLDGGEIKRIYAVEDLSIDELAAKTTEKVDALWNAADKYVAGYISGIAIGLLTLGVVQGKPKALAVTAWSSAVWDAYYTRKATVTATSSVDLDFSTFGPMPHTVPELRTELGL
jgi:hypothetical protein